VLVEAAFMLPIVILVVFGIIEFGMVFKDSLTVSASTRSGTRVGVTMARNAAYLQNVKDAVRSTLLNTIQPNQIQYLTVYKADPVTGNPTGGTFEGCSSDCSRFTYSGGNWVADPGAPGWLASSMKACGAATNTDYLGVYVRVRHDYFTGLFGSSRTLTDHTVLRLEPLPAAQGCQ
jgi:hypothetical protein